MPLSKAKQRALSRTHFSDEEFITTLLSCLGEKPNHTSRSGFNSPLASRKSKGGEALERR